MCILMCVAHETYTAGALSQLACMLETEMCRVVQFTATEPIAASGRSETSCGANACYTADQARSRLTLVPTRRKGRSQGKMWLSTAMPVELPNQGLEFGGPLEVRCMLVLLR